MRLHREADERQQGQTTVAISCIASCNDAPGCSVTLSNPVFVCAAPSLQFASPPSWAASRFQAFELPFPSPSCPTLEQRGSAVTFNRALENHVGNQKKARYRKSAKQARLPPQGPPGARAVGEKGAKLESKETANEQASWTTSLRLRTSCRSRELEVPGAAGLQSTLPPLSRLAAHPRNRERTAPDARPLQARQVDERTLRRTLERIAVRARFRTA